MNGQLVGNLLELFSPPQRKSTIVLLSSSLLLCLWRAFGSRAFYTDYLASHFVLAGDMVATAGWYEIAMCFLLLGLIPMVIVKLVLRESLSDYGVRVGNIGPGIVFVLAAAPIIVLIGYAFSPLAAFAAEYPLNRHAGVSTQAFLVHAASLLFFYIGWEFHFRGFLQSGLTPSSGWASAVCIQTMAATLAHIGKPSIELLACIPASLFWGLLVIRTKSLWAGVLQHWALGVSLDYFLSFRA
ncbi:CAAX amino terminal protease self- immunity [Anatilimnocola aggregata]|uniref:CAAX amino terminal protease self-immunity n=1 Tax=Anatilimnocola aggregata TaxID=2528021 RepID=A0A517YH78_9BACT|nr:CPBP family intramembrane glutamic endopeptidase [Anatilimnocola aggregata]QDU29584.1 CAAX amino terminal protease self- immunity [Anatilimnocola aggregata]